MNGAFAVMTWALLIVAGQAFAATDVRVNFTLNTTDEHGASLAESRNYFVYRPDNLPKSAPVPMVLVMEGGAATFFHRKADQAGFVVQGSALKTVLNRAVGPTLGAFGVTDVALVEVYDLP